MKKLLPLILLLISSPVLAGGLSASFENSRLDCPNDPSVVFCSKGVVDGSNNLLDLGGSNLLTDRTEFDDWIEGGTCAVTADQYRNPVNGAVDADYLDNTGGLNTDSRYLVVAAGVAAGDIYTFSFWVRVDTPHIVTIRLNEQGVAATAYDYPATTQWRRISVSREMVGGGTGNVVTYAHSGELGVSTGTAYFYGAQLVENDQYRTGMGYYINPTDQAITKPSHDLAQNNNPIADRVHLQMQGNKGPARRSDGNRHYVKVHHASMNIFDEDHTVTVLMKQDAGIGASDAILVHGGWNVNGFGLYARPAVAEFVAFYSQGAAVVDVNNATDPDDGRYHIIQVVRDNNTATMYVDGVAGAGFDVTGYGIDANVSLALMANSTGGEDLTGDVSYTVVRSRALSTDELAEEREMLWGTYSNWSDVNAWDFERTTTAYKTFSNQYENTYPSHSMDLVAVDHPRVGGQGSGLLIEGQTMVVTGETEAYDAWWVGGVCAVTANNYMAPNGTMTADELDNTGGVNTDFRYSPSADLGALVGRTFVGSTWVRTAIPHNITFGLQEVGVANTLQTIYATSEWQRVSVPRTMVGGGGGNNIYLRVYPGEQGVATGVAHFWGGNITETPFLTSYISNAGAVTTQVTRTADDMSLDPHPAGVNEYILPETFAPNTNTDRLTLYGEFKCEWSDNVDIGSTQRSLIEISGNAGTAGQTRNRVWFEVTETGRLYGYLRDDSSTSHYVNSAANSVNYDGWFSVRLVLDMTDLSRMDMWLAQPPEAAESNAGMAYTANAGGATFDTIDTLIRIGQQYNGLIESFCKSRNIRITPREIRP